MTYAGSASGLNFLLYAMSVTEIVTRVNIQSANKDAPKIWNELKEGIKLWKGKAESHCSYLECHGLFAGVGNEAVARATSKADSQRDVY